MPRKPGAAFPISWHATSTTRTTGASTANPSSASGTPVASFNASAFSPPLTLLRKLREFAAKLGHSGIHPHASGFYSTHCKQLGFDSFGSYNPVDYIARTHQPPSIEFPDYGVAAADVATRHWTYHATNGVIPYLPGLGAGWDSTPRYALPLQPRPAVPNRDVWPRCAIMSNETPAVFKAFVQAALAYLNSHPETPPVLTIACWNEWSEGHYLLPDNRFGYGYLEALAEALGKPGTHRLHGQ